MSATPPAIILGFHGCELKVADGLLLGEKALRPSTNPWDWLADGAYFWEQDAQRAYDFACQIQAKPHPHGNHEVSTPAVVGAVITPGRCFDLLDSRNHERLIEAYELLKASLEALKRPIPSNHHKKDKILRDLDCAVIKELHEQQKKIDPEREYQTVRSAFFEGEPLYPGGGFADKSHVQIAVRDPACILGCFRPRGAGGEPLVFEPSSPALPANADADAEAHP